MKVQSTKNRLSYKGLLLLFFFVSASADEGATVSTLKHNPFAVPAVISEAALAPSTDAVQSADADQSAETALSAETAQQEMSIRAVLISETATLININGSIVGLHEFVDGYELISLDSERAVLSRHGIELVLGFPGTSNTGGPDPQQQ